jgi:hypothetical protein
MDVGTRFLRFCRTRNLVPADADSNSTVAIAIAGLAPLLFLTVKGWTNALFLILFLLALYDICRRPALYWRAVARPAHWLAHRRTCLGLCRYPCQPDIALGFSSATL